MSEFTAAVDFAISALKRIRGASDRPPRASRHALDRLVRATPPPNDITPGISPNDKRARLAPLRDRVALCRLCPHLASSRTQTVFGVGNVDAELMFIGEAPGADEDRQGEPFVGRAGQLLTKIIAAMGFSRDDVFIANVLKCRPDMPPGEPSNRRP